MYANGLHNDLENPPNVPAITGEPTKWREEKYSHSLRLWQGLQQH